MVYGQCKQKLKNNVPDIWYTVNKISECFADTIEEWIVTSYELILALEEHLCKFLDEDIVELLSYKLLLGE